MKLLLFYSYFHPEVTASSHLTKDLLNSYVNDGEINIDLYVPYPTRGVSDEVRKDYIRNKRREVLYNGRMTVNRYPLMKEGKNTVSRLIRYCLELVKKTYYALRAKGCDVLVMTSTPPINGLMMNFVKCFKKYKIVYCLQDIFPDSMLNAGMTGKDSLAWKLGRFVENKTYKAADKIVVISKDFKKNIMAKGVPEEKIEIVYNWVDENTVINIPRNENKLCEKYGIDKEKFIITYSGNIGHSQNLELLVLAAEKLSVNKDIMFVIIGEGACKEKLVSLVEEKQLENVKILPFQDYSDISHVFSLGDCGLVISKKGIGEASVPSKTWSIMSAQRAVLASFDKGTELDEIITDNNCGICVDADDCDALAEAINKLYSNKENVINMGRNGRKYILENLTKEICTSKMINLLKSM